jgi:hypothetical protein
MKSLLLAAIVLVALAGSHDCGPVPPPSAAETAEDSEAERVDPTEEELLEQQALLKGEKERRMFRIKLWAARLKGDKRSVYRNHGYPSSRYREMTLDRVTETWTYLEEGKRFTFRDNNLIREKDFLPSAAGKMSFQPVTP